MCSFKRRQDVGRVELGTETDLEVADHHFLPALVAPTDFLLRVRVVGTVRRVVEARRYLEARALGLVASFPPVA